MKQNVGVLDTAIRAVISVVLLSLALEGMFATPISVAMASVGLVLFFTCGTGVCPLYKGFGVDTYPTFTEYHYK
jgi:hypothetical protein